MSIKKGPCFKSRDLSRLLAALLDTSLLTAQIAQGVQLRAADAATTGDGDGLQVWRVYWESTLYTDAEGNLADGESLADTSTLTTDADALEELGTLVVTFDNLYFNVQGVTWAEGWDIVAQRCCVDLIKNVAQGNPFQFGIEDPSVELTGSYPST